MENPRDPRWHDPLEVEGRALTVPEERLFEGAIHVSLLITIVGVALYFVGPFAGELKIALTVAGCGLACLLLALRWMTRHETRVRFDTDGVFFRHPGILPSQPVPWTLVVGYRDDQPEVVVLELARRVRLRRTLTVPTLTEPERVAVLAYLDARGIQRLDT